MAQPVIGLIHPGEMGAAVGETLRTPAMTVLWASTGAATRQRPGPSRRASSTPATVEALAGERRDPLDLPAARARSAWPARWRWFEGALRRRERGLPGDGPRDRRGDRVVSRFVDGGIVGPPPGRGQHAAVPLRRRRRRVAALFEGTALETRVVSGGPATRPP